ncbi:MAG TPA: hypothetical protein VMX13_06425, partial [Sedimentisphaerales bacterium]|nr:hypothetical protein [Sedimentisphaerales bacterium]
LLSLHTISHTFVTINLTMNPRVSQVELLAGILVPYIKSGAAHVRPSRLNDLFPEQVAREVPVSSI